MINGLFTDILQVLCAKIAKLKSWELVGRRVYYKEICSPRTDFSSGHLTLG